MLEKISQVITYPIPAPLPRNRDYSVFVRTEGGEWKELDVLLVKVDMHQLREAAMVQFDFSGIVEVEVVCHRETVHHVAIRPLSAAITAEVMEERRIRFTLREPRKLSVEINGGRFNNLHLFAKALERRRPDPTDPEVAVIEPGIHRIEDVQAKLQDSSYTTIYFKPGMHHIEQVLIPVPSGKRIYLSGRRVVRSGILLNIRKNEKSVNSAYGRSAGRRGSIWKEYRKNKYLFFMLFRHSTGVQGFQSGQRHLGESVGRIGIFQVSVLPVAGLWPDPPEHGPHQLLQPRLRLPGADHSGAAAERDPNRHLQAIRAVDHVYFP
ncbi:hypothetical protein FHS18_005172 [Paenibacillus phyllosphaerae]|uniref:Uncharacterized protein n=1 Tax=Paenibacillus phyllosphaerae TaxID=274593 RepID=A0A7W5FQI2_9BACL|nr:hypothetical protein [Paenibacillus phyllosphaerae]MBB3113069.1 hypothetical protein [Paenibacillus phyllosphaerae]